jgi:hypothetical protein
MQTTCRPSALRSVSYLRGRTQKFVREEAGRTASHLVGRVQACPLTTAQTGIAVCDRPHVFDYRCLLWATLPPRLPTTAPAAPRNGVDDLSCTYLRLSPSPCAQLPAWGHP